MCREVMVQEVVGQEALEQRNVAPALGSES